MSEFNGSFALLMNDKGELLLNRDARNPAKLNLNGGGMGMGELPIDAAVRETYEESGRTIFREDLIPIGTYIMRKTYGVTFLFFCKTIQPTQHPQHTCDEVTERVWMHPDKILALPDSEIYPAQRTLIRYYLQWVRDGEKPANNVGFLSPPFEMKGRYFDNV